MSSPTLPPSSLEIPKTNENDAFNDDQSDISDGHRTITQKIKQQPKWLLIFEILVGLTALIGLPFSIMESVSKDPPEANVDATVGSTPGNIVPSAPKRTPVPSPSPVSVTDSSIETDANNKISFPTIDPIEEISNPTRPSTPYPTQNPISSPTSYKTQNPASSTSTPEAAEAAICSTNNDCESGECAHSEYHPDAPLVCCPSSQSTSIWTREIEGWRSNNYRKFCTQQPLGTLCEANDMICELDHACVTGICMVAKIPDNEICQVDNDCISGKCAIEEYLYGAPLICCSFGSSVGVWTREVDGWPSSNYRDFCMRQPLGTLCEAEDRMCSVNSGCVGGVCKETKIQDNESCGHDNDCVSGKCTISEYRYDAPSVCCSSGSSVSVWVYEKDGWEGNGYRDFCTHQPLGTLCGTEDAMCEVNNGCVKGVCQETKVEENDECSHDNDCASGVCAYHEYRWGSPLVCCSSGKSTSVYTKKEEGWTSSTYRDFCTRQPLGTLCNANDILCGVNDACVGGICHESKVADGETCGNDNDCVSDKCAHAEYRGNSPLVCCSSGRAASVWTSEADGWSSNDYRPFCTRQPEGTLCGESDQICKSNSKCVNGVCAK